jgi:hypothetical protein
MTRLIELFDLPQIELQAKQGTLVIFTGDDALKNQA